MAENVGSPEAPGSSLSVHSLRVELLRRGLSTRGLKRTLCARLEAALHDGAGSSAPSVPARFPRKSVMYAAARQRAAQAAEAERAAKRARVDAVGVVRGGAVWVTGAEAMEVVWDVADGYGKGNLSRSEPVYAQGSAAKQAAKSGRAARQLLALESAGKADCAPDRREDVEHLQLTLVEGFHATFDTHLIRLEARDGSRMDDMMEVWRIFCMEDTLFASTYAAYVMYRRAGWMPRSGLKYGVDWVLYRAGGRRHTHAPYCLILSFDGSGLQHSWIRLQNKLRLVKNVAKTLVTAHVSLDLPDPTLPPSPSAALSAAKLTELTVDRWVS